MKVGVTTHKDGEWYVAIDSVTDATSQGKSVNKALKNLQAKPYGFRGKVALSSFWLSTLSRWTEFHADFRHLNLRYWDRESKHAYFFD